MAVWLFASGLVNHPSRMLYLATAIASIAAKARGIREQERRKSGVLFPKDHSNITHKTNTKLRAGLWT